ncbi:MAG: tyrosine-protein phosphatase [Clostridia bacterium]|nr:tyrosine-protein phosphatase [Clostridia bacterium]
MIIQDIGSVQNIRDLGGMITEDGRRIREGCLIRSASLCEAADEDLKRLREAYRLTTVIDLRTAQERDEKPDRVGDCAYLPIPIIENFEAGITHECRTEGMPFPSLRKLYREMMLDTRCQMNFRRVLKTCFEHDYDTGSILWHCSEGKDRCGMTAALLLEALGVDRDAILKDYLETNTTNLPKAKMIYQRVAAESDEKTAECVYQAYIADKSYIENAWAAMGDHYIVETLGFTEQELDAFRERVLE